MAVTLAYNQGDIGKAARSQVMGISGRRLGILTGTIDFGTGYPAGGESLAGIYDQFAECHMVIVEQPVQTGTQTGKFVRVDHTNKKIQLFTNASPYAEVAGASDQSAITPLRFIAVGYL